MDACRQAHPALLDYHASRHKPNSSGTLGGHRKHCCSTLPLHASNGLQVKLLQFVRPQDFDNFRHFVRWRDTTANILLQILQRAAQEPASDDDRSTSALMFLLVGPPALYTLFLSLLPLGPPSLPNLKLLCIGFQDLDFTCCFCYSVLLLLLLLHDTVAGAAFIRLLV